MSEFTRKLIRNAADGNPDAITELYELTYSSVYKTVKSMIADEDTVLDIVQDSFIKGFRSLDQLDMPENFRAWMKRIATNKAKDYLKKKKPILFGDMAHEDGEEIDFQDDCLDYCPEEVLDRKETTRLMDEILATLSEEQRLVIGMFYYEEMSVREIAKSLGCSENTVKSRLSYGRKKVEAKVKELEKRGTKLYSLAPLPFLLWLFRMDAQTAEIPSGMVLEAVTAKCAATCTAAGTAGTTAVASGVKAAAGVGAKVLTTKIIAGVLATLMVGGGTILTLSSKDREVAEPTPQVIAVESNITSETTLPAEPEITISETTVATDSFVPVEEAELMQQIVAIENNITSETTLHAEQENVIHETAVETVSSVLAEEAYQGIAAEYQAIMRVGSSTFLNNRESYFNGDHMAIRYYHMYHDDNFYYAYYDIDENGMEELLIGFGHEDYINIVDLYGFDGERVVQLIDEPTLGDRSKLSLLTDGTLYLFGSSGATEASHDYLRVDGCNIIDAPATVAEEVTSIPWKAFETTEMPVSESSFDSILTDIQTALTISTENYDSNMEFYDGQYCHLGEGVMWMLLHRQAGDYTMCIWNAYLDIEGDGLEELCIGRGVSPNNVAPIVIYKQNGDAICGDAVSVYADLFYGGAPMEWNYLGG